MSLLPRETELLRLHDQFVSDAIDENAVQLLEYIDSNYDVPDATSPQYCSFIYICIALEPPDSSNLTNLLGQYPLVAPVSVIRSMLCSNNIDINIYDEKINPSWMKFNNKFLSTIL